MDSIRKLRIKHEDGSFSNSIPIGANSDDIFMTTGGTLTEAMTDVENAIISMDKINETQSKSIDGLVEGVSSNMAAIAKQQEVNEKQEVKMENFEKALAQEKVYVFDNVYAMKNANNLKAGMYCITKGYYTLNDGGKGEYLIRTKTDNDVDDGGSIHELLNNLVAELIIEDGGVNVKQFGAYGDGEHDDSEKIQSALNYDNIYIPDGTYNISSELISYNTHITMSSNAILKAISSINSIISINPNISRKQYGFIKNGIIDCNNLAKKGIAVSNYQYFTVDNVFVKNVIEEGINFGYRNLADGDAGGCFITNSIIWGSDTADDIGINLQKSNDFTVKSVVLKNCKTGIKTLGGNIKILNVHGWTTGVDKYHDSKMILCSNGRISLSDCVIDTYNYGIYANDQLFVSISNLQYIGIERYSNEYTPIIIFSGVTGTNNSNINLSGLLISANAGTVQLLNDSLLTQSYNTKLQNYSGIENLPSSSNVNLTNSPNNSILYNFKNSSTIEINLSSNYNNLEEVIYRVNTYSGSGGTNQPPSNITGILLNYNNYNNNNDYKKNGTQIIFDTTGKIHYRILRLNVWSNWFTINPTAN